MTQNKILHGYKGIASASVGDKTRLRKWRVSCAGSNIGLNSKAQKKTVQRMFWQAGTL
jgi:hypothetical protein